MLCPGHCVQASELCVGIEQFGVVNAGVGPMSSLQIEVWDATGNKRQTVEVPSNAEVARVIAVLVDRMNLPRHSPDGQLMSYKFHHRGTGRQLLEEETLTQAGVRSGDVLRLQPEITAGAALGTSDTSCRLGTSAAPSGRP